MRLTLRTLLAWIDGVLAPEEQRQLGERVAGSTVATHLAERIRAAIGRTVIGVPRVDAKGLADDPNSVAEYLDNALASEQLEPFERICIESELHLAEVAACHGMLAEVARGSVASADALSAEGLHHLQDRVQRRLVWDRERLAADHGVSPAAADREASLQESRDTARAIRAAIRHEPTGSDADIDRTAGPAVGRDVGIRVAADEAGRGDGGVVRRPRRSSLAAWLAAGVAIGLLFALGGALTWSLVRSRGRAARAVASADVANVPAPVPAAAADVTPVVAAAAPPAASSGPVDPAADRPPAGSAEPAPPADATPVASVQATPAASAAAPQAAPPSTDPVAAAAAAPSAAMAAVSPPAAPATPVGSPPAPPAAAMTAAASPPAALPPAALPPGTAVPPVVPPVVSPATPAAAAVPATPPAATLAPGPTLAPGAADVEVGFVGGEGVLLHRDDTATADAWTYLPPNSRLGVREDLLVPPGFHPELHVRGVTIRLLPSTRAVLTLDADGTPRIEVVFGKAVARSALPDVRLGITAGGLVGRIEAGLTEPVAVEVDLKRFPGTQPGEAPPRSRADVIAASRGISWRQTGRDGAPAAVPLEGIDLQGMLPAGAALSWDSVAPLRAAVAPEPMPAWAESGHRPDRLEKSACEALSARVAATVPLTRALRELVLDRRAENRMLAATTLALVGEYDELVEMLCDDAPGRRLEPRQWAQLEAAAVPLALARGGEAAAALRRAFEARGPNGKADVLWTLACGISDAQIFAGDDRLLVEKLEDPSLVVRRYANKCLVDIVQPSAADRLRYRPDAPPDLRRDGVVWWRQQAERGLIRRPDSVTAGGRGRDAGGRPGAAD